MESKLPHAPAQDALCRSHACVHLQASRARRICMHTRKYLLPSSADLHRIIQHRNLSKNAFVFNSPMCVSSVRMGGKNNFSRDSTRAGRPRGRGAGVARAAIRIQISEGRGGRRGQGIRAVAAAGCWRSICVCRSSSPLLLLAPPLILDQSFGNDARPDLGQRRLEVAPLHRGKLIGGRGQQLRGGQGS